SYIHHTKSRAFCAWLSLSGVDAVGHAGASRGATCFCTSGLPQWRLGFKQRSRGQQRARYQTFYRRQCNLAGGLPAVSFLSLNPGKAGLAPASQGAAMGFTILIAFETFENVERHRVPSCPGCPCRRIGTLAAAAQKEHRGIGVGAALS